jgi:peptidoglycan/LPS O-acetylase OafA/YrhL
MINSQLNYQPKRHITIVESARGFAALYVLIMHVVILTGISTSLPVGSYSKTGVDLFLLYGHQAVLLFFVLSGFSIHYASADRQLNHKQGLLNYYYLRWRRIYPIFFLAVLLTLGLDVLGTAFSLYSYPQDINELDFLHALFTFSFLTDRSYVDGILQPVLNSNGPLWSLSYEVFYYLIYPAYWFISKRYGITGSILLGIILSVSSFVLGKMFGAQHILNVLNLYVIWCLGAVLAEMHRRNISYQLPAYIHTLLIYIMLQAAWVLGNVTYTVGAFFEITWGVLFFLIMLLYIRKDSVHELNTGYKVMVLFIAFLGYLVILAGVNRLHFVSDLQLFYSRITLTLLMFGLGLFIPRFDIQSISNALLKPVYKFGKSSYGIYIIHYPMLLFVIYAIQKTGLPVWLSILFVPVILYLAWVIELRYQPFILQYIDPIALRMHLLKPHKANAR